MSVDKSIQELKDELRIKEMQEYERQRKAKLEKEENFRKENGVDVYTSDDYCGMSNGTCSFYYGYEVTACPKHKGKEHCWRDEDCELREWCFTADVDNKEVMRLRTSQLWGEDGEEPFFYLLGGIARFLKDEAEDSQ